MTRASRFLGAVALALFTAGAVVVLVVILFAAGPFVEGQRWPVLERMAGTVVARSEIAMVVQLTGEKVRNCGYPQEISALVLTSGGWVAAAVKTEGAPPGGAPARPEGEQTFRRLVITPPGTALRLSFRYECHALWDTRFTTPDIPL